MKVKVSLLVKISLLFLCLILAVALVVILFLYRSHKSLTRQQRGDYAIAIAHIVSGIVNEEELLTYADSEKSDEEYEELIEHMRRIQSQSGIFYLYAVAIENEEEGTYIFDLKLVNGEPVLNHRLGEPSSLRDNYPNLTEAFASKSSEPIFDEVEINGEKLDSVYVPILNDEKEMVAFIGIDFDDNEFTAETRSYVRNAAIVLCVVMAVCLLILLLIVQLCILRPVRHIEKHARRIADGKFDGELPVRGHDELSEISHVINDMTRSISGHMEEIRRMSDAYYRYVPARVLTLLGKSSIEEVRLGDETSAVLTVFSFQIADFDRTIRKKSNPEMIDAINRVLRICVPVVADRDGMVENFQNAGFTALFDSECEAALASAVEICQRLNQAVDGTEPERNRAAVGISCGEVALGIVGEKKRMAAITVSQYRDTACWLQGIAWHFQSHILITRTAANRIPGFRERYRTRLLGFLYNTFTGHSDQIYDVYDGDAREELEAKDDTKQAFEAGVELYCTGDFAGARQRFIAVLKRFRRDKASREYLYMCDRRLSGEGDGKMGIYFTKME